MTRLLDKKELGTLHPALDNKWRIEWLIRTRQIPIVRIGRKIFFDEQQIEEWINKHKIPEI